MLDSLRDWWGNLWGRTVQLASTNVLGDNGLIGTGGSVLDLTPAELKPVLNPSVRETAAQLRVIEARQFHEGLVGSRLPRALRDALGEDTDSAILSLNFVANINRAVAERLHPADFSSEADGQTEADLQAQWAQQLWDTSRMRGKRALFFLEAVRDGEAFFILDPDAENGRARITPHGRYTDLEAGGDGEGVQMFYPNDDPDQRPLFAVKRWTEQVLQSNGGYIGVKRINLYEDGRIRKYRQNGITWQKFEDTPFTVDGTPGGLPIGLPVVHLKSPELRPAAERAFGAQRGLDRTYVTMLSGAEVDLLRIFVAFGWQPENTEITPGVLIGTQKAPGEASLEVIEGSDATRYIELIDKQVALMSDLTNTPLSLIQRSAQRAAEGTLQEEKETFFAKVQDYADTFAMAIEDAFRKARTIHNVYFSGGAPLSEDAAIRVQWKAFTARTTTEKAEEATALKDSGVPDEEIWRRVWGFDEETVERMKQAKAAAAFGGVGFTSADDEEDEGE